MKILLYLATITLLFAACKKEKTAPIQTITLKDKMNGKWDIISVTTLFRNATGDSIGSKTYPEPKGDYFKFNADGTWLENLDPDNGANDLGISGFYTLNSESDFTLLDQAKTTSTPCKVPAISASQFTFTHQKSTLFNGVTPGFIEYIFVLSRDR